VKKIKILKIKTYSQYDHVVTHIKQLKYLNQVFIDYFDMIINFIDGILLF